MQIEYSMQGQGRGKHVCGDAIGSKGIMCGVYLCVCVVKAMRKHCHLVVH